MPCGGRKTSFVLEHSADYIFYFFWDDWAHSGSSKIQISITPVQRGYAASQTTYIAKTCLYNFDPIKPNFYIVKLGFTGVYIIFLISAQNIDCGYSLEPPRLCFEQKQEKYQNFLSENFHFFGDKIFSTFE